MAVDQSGGAGVFDNLPFSVPVQYRPVVLDAAVRYGIRPRLLAAQIEAESGFQNLGTNASGATGIAQFTAATALSQGVNPRDPVSSIFGAAKLDAAYIQKFGSEGLALAAYNAGPSAPGIAEGRIPDYPETQAYVTRILGWAGVGGDATATTAPDASDPSASATPTAKEALAKIGSGTAWTRLGKGALGILLAMVGMWFAFSKGSLSGTVKKAAKHGL